MILTLHVDCGFDDPLQPSLSRIETLDKAIIFDAIEIDVVGTGAALYDRLRELRLRAPVVASNRLANYSAGLLKK